MILLEIENMSTNGLVNLKFITVIYNLDFQRVKDRAEAVEMIIQEGLGPDPILLVINMPRMNGFDVLKILKRNNETKYIPNAILSTSANKKDISRAYSLGTYCYIVKEVEIIEFQSKIQSIPIYWLCTNTIPQIVPN